MTKRAQYGFTLVEIAVVLVIIGLLLGGVLKGQELIASARVRHLADQRAAIEAAFHGFRDRYRAVPGDMPRSDADHAIGAGVTSGGNGNGRVDAHWAEVNAAWEHLSRAGFIQGSYPGAAQASTGRTAPTNVFGGVLVLAHDDGYAGAEATRRRLLHLGRNVPAAVARELDVKIDDGRPATGRLRNAATRGSPLGEAGQSAPGCTRTGEDGTEIWDVDADVQDCNPTYLF
ncbi:MAG: prepilin-type N-terminal cleavage/methylation domain-containing protein [Halofilum sp. (in: g-proteobacteria)]|nr:prepilin-type N-terminal cleavage/methylation domain-containing protein [Halofilum sp. (in: g-proteobacteria)]